MYAHRQFFIRRGTSMSSTRIAVKPPLSLETQLKEQRRTVDFDTFDIHVQQLLQMLKEGQIWAAPRYQRLFRWDDTRCSQFIESLMLGIPIPSLFMATNPDSSWEVVDGLQRLSALVKFAGGDDLRKKLNLHEQLRLSELKKLEGFNGLCLQDFPPTVKQHFLTRPCKVITLNDKSDNVVRYDLFERLNTGGIALSPQEIRDCVFSGPFADKLDQLSKEKSFQQVVKLTKKQQRDATGEECVLRFFAFKDRYKDFDHSVGEFLNSYMEDASKKFDYTSQEAIFSRTFAQLARAFPRGIRRPGGKMATPLNLYEGITVGAALALSKVDQVDTSTIKQWLPSDELRRFTTGATNDWRAVKGRIEFCRDRFLGKPYVPSTAP